MDFGESRVLFGLKMSGCDSHVVTSFRVQTKIGADDDFEFVPHRNGTRFVRASSLALDEVEMLDFDWPIVARYLRVVVLDSLSTYAAFNIDFKSCSSGKRHGKLCSI